LPERVHWSAVARWWGPIVVIAASLGWLWPIGLGGRMPVGGDVTQFQIGLMAVLAEALEAGRLPLWNDRWGFGFPGLAESQMGVYSPVHLILYSILSVERAYTWSFVLHVVWGALGVHWAAKRFGVSEGAAVLAAVVWLASDFFRIHEPHQWSYSVGSWAPWAWGLGWRIASGERSRSAPFGLAAVLALQLLPGHFQLAFETQLGLMLLGFAGLWRSGSVLNKNSIRHFGILLFVIGASFLLAAGQILPTAALARIARETRAENYLADFAETPLHLVNLVAPELFHRSPLWRPIVWDPLHTSPEEAKAAVGLVPLFLALGGLRWSGANHRAVIALTALGGVGLLLSLGPWVPGFGLLSRLPGFSFFRAPARWFMLPTFSLAVLAGFGLDALRSGAWRRPGRGLTVLATVAAVWIALVVGLFELGLQASRGSGNSTLISVYAYIWELQPWGEETPIREVFERARRPQNDLRVRSAQAEQGLGRVTPGGLRFDRERWRIYRAELGVSAALIAACWLWSLTSRQRGLFLVGLLILTSLDIIDRSRRKPIETGPMRALTSQSPVLEKLSAAPCGTRSIDPLLNLPMIAGAAPLSGYRTLDIPIQQRLLREAQAIRPGPNGLQTVFDSQRVLGTGFWIVGPIENGAERFADAIEASDPERRATVIDDPALLSWMTSSAYAATPGGRRSRFVVVENPEPACAWRVPGDEAPSLSSGAPGHVRRVLLNSRSLDVHTITPEHVRLTIESDAGDIVVLTRLFYPAWHAAWIDEAGRSQAAAIKSVLGGWQGVEAPGDGRFELELRYDGSTARRGLALSALGWAVWGLGWWRLGRTSSGASKRSSNHPIQRTT